MTVLNLNMNLLPVHKKTWSVSRPRTAHPCQFTGTSSLTLGLQMWPPLPSASSHPQFHPSISFLEGALHILRWAIASLSIFSPLQLGPDPCHVTERAIFCQSPFTILLYRVSAEPGAADLVLWNTAYP